ncbi:MAG: type II secretion system protein GspD [Desulfosoma sp.]
MGKGWTLNILYLMALMVMAGCASSGMDKKAEPSRSLPGVTKSAPPSDGAGAYKPVFKEISPLDARKVTLSFVQEDFHTIFLLLAQEAGLHLVMDKEVQEVIPAETRFVTISFKQVSLRRALDALADMVGVTYRVDKGVLRVQAFEEKVFNLSFILTARGSRFTLGGDVLGGVSEGGQGGGAGAGGGSQTVTSPLKGLLELEGESAKDDGDLYQFLDHALGESLLSPQGKYALDRFTGTLLVRDFPANVRRVENLVENLRKRYENQVTIEARIVEVELSRSHEFGVEWQAVLQEGLGGPDWKAVTKYMYGPQATDKTFVMQLSAGNYLDAILKTIETYGNVNVISNPRIRVMHGQPAVITVGTSIAYIKSISRSENAYLSQTTITTTVETSSVFDGLTFGVTPYVQPNGDVLLSIVPIKSDVVALNKEEVENNTVTLPIVNLRSSTTVVKLKPDDVVILAGILLDRSKKDRSQVPVLGSLPVVGSLFGSERGESKKVEMIIFLEARLM